MRALQERSHVNYFMYSYFIEMKPKNSKDMASEEDVEIINLDDADIKYFKVICIDPVHITKHNNMIKLDKKII